MIHAIDTQHGKVMRQTVITEMIAERAFGLSRSGSMVPLPEGTT